LQAVDAGYRDDNIKNAKGRLSCQYCEDPKEQGFMQILVLNWRDIRHPEAGGAEINIHEQAKRWVEWGHRVTMFTARPRGHKFRDNINGIEIFRMGGRFSVYPWAIFVYLLVLRKRTDVILDIENGIPFFTPLYSRKPKVLLMHHLHQDQFLIEMGSIVGRIGRFLERIIVPILYRSSKIVAVSHSTADRKRGALYKGSDLEIDVIHNGLDHSLYGSGKQEFPEPTIIYLGRLKAYKRLPLLIKIMPAVRKQVPGVTLIIAGDGDALSEVEAEVDRLGVGDFVRFAGRVSEKEKIDLLQRAWVMATPSMNEGWGVTVIEANACGTPAVAYRVPGLDESIAHCRSGLLAESDEEFAQHLVSILNDPKLRQKLSQGAVEWAAAFDWDETAREMLKALEASAPWLTSRDC
jgi:glycosyltransferase involved in cell wall biosynthesis